MKWQFEFTQLKGFQLLSLLCRIHWLLDWTGGLYSGAKLLVQGIVSMDSSCKTQATLSSMNWIVQNQHQTREMLVNAQIHNSVNFHQRMLSGVCKKKKVISIFAQPWMYPSSNTQRNALGYFSEWQ